MSTIRTPVGPQPSKVYWRRRLVVLIGVLAVVLIIVLIVVRPGGGKPTAANTHTPHTAVANAPACVPADIKVVAVTDALSYAPGVDPQLSLTITNTGSAACSFQDGSDKQVYVITSGTEKIWSSKDCQTGAVAHTSVLEPSKSVSSSPFAWNRTRSNPAACSATNAPQVIAGGASYHLTVSVDGISSSKADSPQFLLK